MEYKYDDYDDYEGYESTEKLLRFLLVEKKLSFELRDAINEKATKFLESLTSLKEEVGSFLCSDMNDAEHSEDDIRTLVQCVPKSLKQKTRYADGWWNFPIGSVTSTYTTCRKTREHRQIGLSLIPILADEGMKLNVFGDGMRGGLLCKDSSGRTQLWRICKDGGRGGHETSDLRLLDVIKRLREMGLVEKEDIKKYGLLHCYENMSEYQNTSKRFNYFVDWDPSALKQAREFEGSRNDTTYWLLQICPMDWVSKPSFQLALNATLRHYPYELVQVLLLNKNDKDTGTFQAAKNKFGKQALELFDNCLNAEPNGSKILHEKNPETNMYAFMDAAAGDTNDLDLVYHLIRRNPLVLEHAEEKVNVGKVQLGKSKKN